MLPSLNCNLGADHFGIPLADIPAALRAEIMGLLQFYAVEFNPERDRRKYSAVTITQLRQVIGRIYGYAVSVRRTCVAEIEG